jgi:hypothetical protein
MITKNSLIILASFALFVCLIGLVFSAGQEISTIGDMTSGKEQLNIPQVNLNVLSGQSIEYYLKTLNAKIVIESTGSKVNILQSGVAQGAPAATGSAAPSVVGDLKSFTFLPVENPADVSYDLSGEVDSKVGISFFVIKDNDYSNYKITKVNNPVVFESKKVGTNLYRVLIFDSASQYIATPKDSTSALPNISPFFVVTSSSKDKEFNEGDSFTVKYVGTNFSGEYSATLDKSDKFIQTKNTNATVSGTNPFSITFTSGANSNTVVVELQDNLIAQDKVIVNSIK